RGVEVFEFESWHAAVRVVVDRNLLPVMTPAPAPVVQRLAHRNAIEPGLERAAAPESANPAKCAQEYFLSHVGGIRRIGEYSVDEVIYAAVVVGDEPFECGVGTRLEFGYELGFVSAPRQTLREIRHFLRLIELRGSRTIPEPLVAAPVNGCGCSYKFRHQPASDCSNYSSKSN